MNSTFIHPSPEEKLLLVTPYRKDDRSLESEPWNMGLLTAAGGIFSNVTDLSKLMIAQIQAYRNLNRAGKADDPLIVTENENVKGTHYGFGLWMTVNERGVEYEHGGDLDGYASTYLFSPKQQKGLIILTSSGGSWVGELESLIGATLGF